MPVPEGCWPTPSGLDEVEHAVEHASALRGIRGSAVVETQPPGARETQGFGGRIFQVGCRPEHSVTNARVRLSAHSALGALDCADMTRLASGDGVALARLMLRHRQWLLGWLSRVLGNSCDAADVIQEAFLRVYIHRHRFDPQRGFRGWLSTIAINLARSRLRWRRRQPPQVSLSEDASDDGGFPMTEAFEFVDQRPPPGDSLQRSEWLDALGRAVARLPALLRVPLERFALDEISQEEIAHDLGCSVKTVEMRIYRARQRIREDMEEFGGKPEGCLLSKRNPSTEPFRARPSEGSAAGPG